MSDLKESLLSTLQSFNKAMRKNRQSSDLIFHEFLILRNILRLEKEENKRVHPSYLSDRLNLSRSYITAVLNSLEEKKMLVRKMDTEDRRRVTIEITKKGRDVFDDLIKNELQVIDKIIHNLSIEKTLVLVDLLKQATSILNEEENL